jgi:Chaperone of endosialidase
MSTISASTTTTTGFVVTSNTTGTLVLQTGDTPTTAVTIDGSQNVGIGTSSPASKLHVSNVVTSGASGGGDGSFVLKRASDGLTVGSLSVDSANSLVNLYTAYSFLTFSNSAGEAFRVDGSKNLLVGQTSAGSQNLNSFSLQPSIGQFVQNHVSGTGSGNYYSGFYYNNTNIGSISQNGTTGVLYNLTSDYRLKNDQQPLTGAKEFVMALQPKKWQWRDGSGEGVGFVAHEFMEVAKYSGQGEKDAVDDEGKPVYQSIQPSSSEVMANLVSFIQELKAELDAAKADIATLKGAA